ncbi:MAG: metallophosphoesterase [Armatimonadota bacterium]
MAIYAISDLHLSLGSPKPMDIFGPAWVDHAEKLRRNWDECVRDTDTVLLPGDLSWAIRFSDAKPDLDFVAQRPGRKVLIRGNHDFWWQRKMTARIQHKTNRSMTFLQGTSVVINGIGITGTRGWRIDWEARGEGGMNTGAKSGDERVASPEKVLRRELKYLEEGIKSIPDSAKMKIVMLHYPPFDERLQTNEFAELLKKYSVDILVYGHVHQGLGTWLSGDVDGTIYHLVSADIVDFMPQLIVP